MDEHEPRVTVLPPDPQEQSARPPAPERTWAMLCHFSAFLGYVLPFGHILGPLGVWLFKAETFPLVDDQGKESLNFELSMTLYLIIAAVLIVALIGIPLIGALIVFHLIVVVIAAVRARDGVRYRYPLTIRFLK